jgi:phage repressor protein C with HTH and peptisase S24 domain
MGVSPSAFRKWLKGEAEPSRERLVALANATGVSIAWLVTGEGPEPDFVAPPGAGRRARPRAESHEMDATQFALLPRTPETEGAVLPPDPALTGFMALRHDWIRATFGLEPRQMAMQTAIGESMAPTINSGDLLLIDTTQQDLGRFGIYAIDVNGNHLVKRVQRRLDGGLLLISDNPRYVTESLTADQARAVKVLGQVVWSAGAL